MQLYAQPRCSTRRQAAQTTAVVCRETRSPTHRNALSTNRPRRRRMSGQRPAYSSAGSLDRGPGDRVPVRIEMTDVAVYVPPGNSFIPYFFRSFPPESRDRSPAPGRPSRHCHLSLCVSSLVPARRRDPRPESGPRPRTGYKSDHRAKDTPHVLKLLGSNNVNATRNGPPGAGPGRGRLCRS